MNSPPYLRLTRDGTYQYRRAIPLGMRARFGGKTEIVVSLRTRDLNVAKRQIKPIADGVDKQFSDARKGRNIDTDVLNALSVVGGWLDAINDELERQNIDDGFDEPTPEPPLHDAQEIEQSLSRYIQYLGRNDYHVRSSVLAHVGRLAPIEYYRDRAIRDRIPDYTGDFDDLEYQDQVSFNEYRFGRGILPDKKPTSPPPPPVETDDARTLLSDVLEAFLKKKGYSPKTEHEWRAAWQRLIQFVGDIAIGDLKRKHLIGWLDLMEKIPASMSNRERQMPLLALIAHFDGRAYDTISAATVDKSRSAIRSVLIWAEGRYIEHSPARGLRPEARPKDTTAQRRLPFSVGDMNIIFSTPIYAGCASATKRTKPGKLVIEDSYFWLPLLAAFTGARLEELGQLLTEDVRRKKNIDFFDITTLNDDTKRLKTDASTREVPIHSKLIELGFLQYVERTRQKGKVRLFPDLERDSRGSYTQAFSRQWNRWLRRFGIGDERKVFHSFRHAFKDAARRGDVPKQQRDRLQGHALEDEAEKYGLGWELPALKRQIEKVRYTGLKLPIPVKRPHKSKKPAKR